MYDNIRRIGLYMTTGIACLATAFTLYTSSAYGEGFLERTAKRIIKLPLTAVILPVAEGFGTFCKQIEEDGLNPVAIGKGALGGAANSTSTTSARLLESTVCSLDPNKLDTRDLYNLEPSKAKEITDAISDPFKAD